MEIIEQEVIKEMQRELSELIGVSGRESKIVEYIQEKIRNFVDEMYIDPLGSLIAIQKGTEEKNRIMFDAHIDEIGLMINHIEENGFLRFCLIGGWDTRILLGASVKIVSETGEILPGIIGSTPPHLLSEKERNTLVEVDQMFIDVGLNSKKEIEEKGIQLGSVGTLYNPFVEFPGDLIRGKAFDDRTGVNILIQIIKKFSAIKISDTLLFSFTSQEEIGGRGAATAAYSLNPTMAIAIENTTAGDVPGIKASQCPAYIGKGPAISVADRSLIANQGINDRLKQNAEFENIPYQIKKPIFGGTNAGRIHQTRGGIPSSVVSVPCRYIHSSTSLLSLTDIHNTIRLISAFILNPAKV